MGSLMEVARNKGLKTMEGEVLASNSNMLKMVATLGFNISDSAEDPGIKAVVRML
jgi:acetyltransferase